MPPSSPSLQETLRRINSLAPGLDDLASLWQQLQTAFELERDRDVNPPLGAQPSCSSSSSSSSSRLPAAAINTSPSSQPPLPPQPFPRWALANVNRAVLVLCADHDLNDEILALPPDQIKRLRAPASKLNISIGLFIFLFGKKLAASRAAADNVSQLLKTRPDVTIHALLDKYLATGSLQPTKETVRGTVPRSDLDIFKSTVNACIYPPPLPPPNICLQRFGSLPLLTLPRPRLVEHANVVSRNRQSNRRKHREKSTPADPTAEAADTGPSMARNLGGTSGDSPSGETANDSLAVSDGPIQDNADEEKGEDHGEESDVSVDTSVVARDAPVGANAIDESFREDTSLPLPGCNSPPPINLPLDEEVHQIQWARSDLESPSPPPVAVTLAPKRLLEVPETPSTSRHDEFSNSPQLPKRPKLADVLASAPPSPFFAPRTAAPPSSLDHVAAPAARKALANLPLLLESLQTIQPMQWLNSTVIYTFLSRLESENVGVVDPLVFQASRTPKTHQRLQNTFSKPTVLMVVNNNHHWILYRWRAEDSYLFEYDSLGSAPREVALQVKSFLQWVYNKQANLPFTTTQASVSAASAEYRVARPVPCSY
ncbi:hypothetical protein EsH8_XIV_000033 [Colletotrichum jinshuiense]